MNPLIGKLASLTGDTVKQRAGRELENRGKITLILYCIRDFLNRQMIIVKEWVIKKKCLISS